MDLPQTAQYALRAMGVLALMPPGQCVPARDLAEATGIPNHYLSKVMRRLVEDGLLRSKRGHHGGFALARPPELITVGEVLAAVDYATDGESCAFGWDRCNPDRPCPLHPMWSRLKDAFSEWAHHTTLADIEHSAEVRAILVPTTPEEHR